MNIVEYKNFSLSFKDDKSEIEAVKSVSFKLKKGEILGVVGSSGSGKTVTAMSLMGLVSKENIKFQSGEILYNGLDITKLSEKQIMHIRGNKIAAIYQDPLSALNPLYTVGTQITEGIHIHEKVSKKDAKKRAIKMLEKVGINYADKVFDAYPNELSGGQRQRVIIAMALVLNPDVLIADEITTALDVTVQAQILNLLLEIREEFSMSIIVITHDFGVVAQVCDRALVMNDGKVVEEGNVFDIFDNPKSEHTKELLSFILAENTKHVDTNNNEVILKVTNLKKSFPYEKSIFKRSSKQIHAVDNVSFELKKGETLAIVGESGSGKSTLAKSIIGLHKINSGKIESFGKDLKTLSHKEKAKFIQMVFQDPYSSLNPTMKIRDILSEGMLCHDILPKDKIEEEIKRLLIICGLKDDILDRYAREFSGGQRQRIALARAISLNSNIVIADEAVSALDSATKIQIVELMLKLQKEIGMSYIFISHDLGIVKYIASRVAVMYLGEFVEIGDINEIYNNPRHPYTKLLLDSVAISHPRFREKTKALNDEINIDISVQGCKFSKRCPYAKDICFEKVPELRTNFKNHSVACHIDK